MKIIGHTQHGYLVEASEADLAAAGGYSAYDRDWKNLLNNQGKLPVGTVVKAAEANAFLRNLAYKEEEVKKGLAAMRAIADLVEGRLPSVAFPAPPEPLADEVAP